MEDGDGVGFGELRSEDSEVWEELRKQIEGK